MPTPTTSTARPARPWSTQADQVLGGLQARAGARHRRVAVGVPPLDLRRRRGTDRRFVYDGYLIHSRGAAAGRAPLDADTAMPDPTLHPNRSRRAGAHLPRARPTSWATSCLGYGRALLPDSPSTSSGAGEVAGTAHADAYNLGIGDGDDSGAGQPASASFAAMQSPPDSLYGGVITCSSPINTGPQTYVPAVGGERGSRPVGAVAARPRRRFPASSPRTTAPTLTRQTPTATRWVASAPLRSTSRWPPSPASARPAATSAGCSAPRPSRSRRRSWPRPTPTAPRSCRPGTRAVDAAVSSGAVMQADRQHLVDAAQASNVGA